MKKLLLPLMATSALLASDTLQVAMLDDYEMSLMEGLEEVSDIATKTKLNIDQTPAFITIIYNDTLMEYGINTAFEALSLVPGVELSMEPSGAKQVIFRGIKEKGKIKLLIDGVPVNNTYRGSMYHYLDFSADLIDRIEMIRGPGSVLYGSNAINAVINIVTKGGSELARSGVYAAAGSYDQHQLGATFSHKSDTINLSVDAYGQEGDQQIKAGPDASGYSGKTYEAFDDYSAGIAVNNETWNFLARTKNTTLGTAYGTANYLEQDVHRPGIRNTTHFAELTYKKTVGIHDLLFKAGTNHYEQYVDSTFRPIPGGTDLVYGLDYAESGLYMDATATSALSADHTLVYGLHFDYTEALKEKLFSNIPGITSPTMVKPDISRTVTAAYVQSSYTAGDSLDILAGVRGDHFSDFGDALSPRLAAVYAVNNETNIKAMYSRAFRAPSWIELYGSVPNFTVGDPTLTAETADTVELGIVTKKDINNLVRLNFFYTNVNDIIYRNSSRIYTQQGTSHFYGGELEYKKRLGLETTTTFNLSHTDGMDKESNAVSDIANNTANLRLSHKFESRIASGSSIKYVSERKRVDGDTRDNLSGYTTLDQTFSYRFANGMVLSFTAKNLADADVVYPAAPNSYPDDYPREGRTFWVKASWEI